MEAYHSKAKIRRVVGFLDGVLSVALIVQIVCYTIIPLLSTQAFSYNLLSSRNPPGEPGGGGGHWWIWPFLGLCVLFAIIPLLAATALVMSTSPNIAVERSLDMTKLWMHCNSFTILLATIEFIVVLLIHLLHVRIGVPIPTLLYLGFRAVVTVVILKQMDTMSPSLIATVDANLIEEKRARYQAVNQASDEHQRAHHPPDSRASIQSPVMPLRPYRGSGSSSVPNSQNPSQCVASQTD